MTDGDPDTFHAMPPSGASQGMHRASGWCPQNTPLALQQQAAIITASGGLADSTPVETLGNVTHDVMLARCYGTQASTADIGGSQSPLRPPRSSACGRRTCVPSCVRRCHRIQRKDQRVHIPARPHTHRTTEIGGASSRHGQASHIAGIANHPWTHANEGEQGTFCFGLRGRLGTAYGTK